MSYNRKAWEKRNKPFKPKKSYEQEDYNKPIKLTRKQIKQQLRKEAA